MHHWRRNGADCGEIVVRPDADRDWWSDRNRRPATTRCRPWLQRHAPAACCNGSPAPAEQSVEIRTGAPVRSKVVAPAQSSRHCQSLTPSFGKSGQCRMLRIAEHTRATRTGCPTNRQTNRPTRTRSCARARFFTPCASNNTRPPPLRICRAASSSARVTRTPSGFGFIGRRWIDPEIPAILRAGEPHRERQSRRLANAA